MTNTATTPVPTHLYCSKCQAATEQNLEQPREDSAAICQTCGEYYWGCYDCGGLVDRWGNCLRPEVEDEAVDVRDSEGTGADEVRVAVESEDEWL